MNVTNISDERLAFIIKYESTCHSLIVWLCADFNTGSDKPRKKDEAPDGAWECPWPQMLLPAVWQNNKRKATQPGLAAKRQRISNDEECEARALKEIACIIEHSQSRCGVQQAEDSSLRIDVQSILNDIPFERLLGSISTTDTMPDVPIVSRVYEERFMRESMTPDEKDCIMGHACECMLIDSSNPFVCTQFVIPNISNEHQGMCVLCLRKTTQLLYYKTIYTGMDVKTLIQKYGNICNQVRPPVECVWVDPSWSECTCMRRLSWLP